MTDNRNNKRIIINTIALSGRMLITMCIGLYTSRLILANLGIEDYGIYNVVGGVVTLFSFLSTAMLNGTQRYLNFYSGRNDVQMINKVFSGSIHIFMFIGLIIIFLGEIIGIYFINYKLKIPNERIIAANWILQFSIITVFINVISTPYNAMIVAFEKMTTFAYISIFQSFATFIITYSLVIFASDRLIIYGGLMCILNISIRIFYSWYVKKAFPSVKYIKKIDRNIIKEMFSFSIWTLTGTFSYMLCTQGLSLLMNMFFGPIVNAAQGIAQQVKGTVTQFANNFGIASKPQITKCFAEGNLVEMKNLLFLSSKISFVIMICLVFPLINRIDYILNLWLTNVPEHANSFIILLLISAIVDSLVMQIVTAIYSTGEIKKFQILDAISFILILPITYIFYKNGFQPEFAYIVFLVLTVLNAFIRLFFYKKQLNLSASEYIWNIFIRNGITGIWAYLALYIFSKYIPYDLGGFILTCCFNVVFVILIASFITFTPSESKKVYRLIFDKFINMLAKH